MIDRGPSTAALTYSPGMSAPLASLAGLLALAACSSSPGGPGVLVDGQPAIDAAVTADGPGPGPDAAGRPRFQTCRDRPFTPAPPQAWRHTVATPITTAAGAANHGAQDPLAAPASAIAVQGRFVYGLISSALKDEQVAVWLDDCAGWRALGQPLTDANGVAEATIAAGTLTSPGVYEVRFQVLGDQSQTRGYVWVLPAGTHLAVADIDGTLTSSDAQLFQQILDGTHVPVAYPGAIDLTTAHAGRGHVLAYLTGRPYYLTQRSRDWLTNLGFAPGPVHLTASTAEALPTNADVGDYKKHYLQGLVTAGYLLDVAYGNATTDIYAYLGAGLAAGRVWIIGNNGGAQGTHAVTDSWVARVAQVRASAVVLQPFDW